MSKVPPLSDLMFKLEGKEYVNAFDFREAAESGDMEAVQYLYKRNCPWNDIVSACAARGGHLLVLQWLIARGCPWSYVGYVVANANGQTKVVEWIETGTSTLNSIIFMVQNVP